MASNQLPYAGFRDNPKFSDLQIYCDGKVHYVHRMVVCSRSEVLDKACDGGFMEANTRVIEHSEFNSLTLDRMLDFLYTGDYTVHDQHSSPDGTDEVQTSSPISLSKVQEVEESADRSAKRSFTEAFSDAREDDDVLMAHILVHGIADYYALPDLKLLAVEKFKAAWKDKAPIAAQVLFNLVRAIYSRAARTDDLMRTEFLELVTKPQMIVADRATLMKTLGEQNDCQEFATDLLDKTLHRASIMRDELNRQEAEITLLTTQAQQDQIALETHAVAIAAERDTITVHQASIAHKQNIINSKTACIASLQSSLQLANSSLQMATKGKVDAEARIARFQKIFLPYQLERLKGLDKIAKCKSCQSTFSGQLVWQQQCDNWAINCRKCQTRVLPESGPGGQV